MSGSADTALNEVLERARSVGFLGPGPVEAHIDHAGHFLDALAPILQSTLQSAPQPTSEVDAGRAGVTIADIGSGGGVPGLALLVAEPGLSAVLIDAAQKRCSFLVWAVAELGLGDRVEVWCGRAEELGHEERARERFDAVVARGFGPPSTTLECATALVRPGGRVVVSEPPQRRRWPAEALAELALVERPPAAGARAGVGTAVFERLDALAERFPRSAKEQQRFPLFTIE